jgi:hypothetical protein
MSDKQTQVSGPICNSKKIASSSHQRSTHACDRMEIPKCSPIRLKKGFNVAKAWTEAASRPEL